MSPMTEPVYATSVQGNTNENQSDIDNEDDTCHGRSKTAHSGIHIGFNQERNANDHLYTKPPAKMPTISASPPRSDPSEVELDCSSYEILAQNDQHNDHYQSPKDDAAAAGLNENANRNENSISMSTLSSGKGLDDSGTEADDEGRVGTVLVRKDGQREIIRRRNKEVSVGSDHQRGSMRTDYEVLRIAIEAGILVGVYLLSYRSSAIWEERHWLQKVSLLCHACVALFFIANHALRCSFPYLHVLLFRKSSNHQSFFAQLPCYFDSASALYPPVLPVIVALSLLPKFDDVFIANCMLGLSALPVELIHSLSYSSSSSFWFSSVSLYIIDQCHWLISITPLIFLQLIDGTFNPQNSNFSSIVSPKAHIPIENLTLLYPFHQSLISILHYLTSSSLLPAERQLLSISLIDLYIFSESPPAVILKAVIWIGGLGILLTCRHVVEFKHSPSQSLRVKAYQKKNTGGANSGTWKFVRELLRRAIGHQETDISATRYNESDADEDEIHKHSKYIDDESKTLRASFNGDSMLPHASVKTFTDSVNVLGYRVPSEANERESRNETSSVRCQDEASMAIDRGKWSNIYANIRSNKGLHAAYIYSLIFAIIIWPFRLYISERALHGYEAIGWIIGYLISDVPYFRDWIESSELRIWIPVSSLSPQLPFALDQALMNTLVRLGNFRLLFICHWLLILALGLRLILNLPPTVTVDTRRKIFHGMMILILVPTTPVDPTFISLALTVVLALFLLLEFIRISGLPPLSKPLALFLRPYVDGRDVSGPIVISHIFLLLGCAIPAWLSLAAASPADNLATNDNSTTVSPWQGWNLRSSLSADGTGTDMLSGVICVGLGDAAASLVGRRYGRKKWSWSPGSKSVEGSTAFAVALFTGLTFVKMWLYFLGWGNYSVERCPSWLSAWSWLHFIIVVVKIAAASCVASLTEAVLTGGNDNIIVPLVLWAVVRGLEL